jgi:hypothetical protein
MKRTKLILASLGLALPLAMAVHLRTVKGSEPPGRLVDNHDGTVTDTVTHLIWQQVGMTAGTNGVTNQATAVTYCQGLSLGNLPTGWRLPAIKELTSIVDYESQTQPAIDTAMFQNTSISTSYPYYTTSPTICVYFGTGAVTNGGCSGGDPVRCVHSASLGADGGVP